MVLLVAMRCDAMRCDKFHTYNSYQPNTASVAITIATETKAFAEGAKKNSFGEESNNHSTFKGGSSLTSLVIQESKNNMFLILPCRYRCSRLQTRGTERDQFAAFLVGYAIFPSRGTSLK